MATHRGRNSQQRWCNGSRKNSAQKEIKKARSHPTPTYSRDSCANGTVTPWGRFLFSLLWLRWMFFLFSRSTGEHGFGFGFMLVLFFAFFFFLSKGNRFFSLKVNGEVWLDLHDNGCVSRENWISLCASPNKSFRFQTEKQCYRYKILTVSIDFFILSCDFFYLRPLSVLFLGWLSYDM